MAPNTIILGNNESHTIALGSFIRIKAWIMPDDLSGIKLEVSGDVSYNRSNDAQLYVTDCRGRVEIIVKPASGGEFPPDHSVILMVDQPTAGEHICLEFEEARVDGAAERVLGEITPVDEDFVLVKRYQSGDGGNLPREAMTVVSALRAQGVSHTSTKSLQVVFDATASMNASVAPDDLEIVNNVIRGIAYHLDIDVAGDLQSQLALYQAEAPSRVGSPAMAINPRASVAVVTNSPRPYMSTFPVPTLVFVVGKQATPEAWVYQKSYGESQPLHIIVIDDAQKEALQSGNHAAFHHYATVVQAALNASTSVGDNQPANPFGGN